MGLYSILLVIFVAAILLAVVYIFQKISNEENTQQLLDESFSSVESEIEINSDKNDIISYVDSQVLDRFPWLGEQCRFAGIKMPASVVAALAILISIAAAIGASVAVSPSLGPILGAFVPVAAFGLCIAIALLILYFMVQGKTREFDEQFGIGLEVLSAAMRAGNTFSSGIKFIAESMDPPLGREFGIVSTEMNLGVDVPTAMERMRERNASKNLFLFTTAVKVANATGAALAPTFIVLANIIAERFRLQGQINIAIAENFGAMAILAMMPWIVIPFLTASWPDAFQSFSDALYGQIILIILFLWYCFGLYLMFKTVKSLDV